jgi:hypothetical protein
MFGKHAHVVWHCRILCKANHVEEKYVKPLIKSKTKYCRRTWLDISFEAQGQVADNDVAQGAIAYSTKR